MKKDFTQSYLSPALVDFKEKFNNKWELNDYHDINAPLVFFGMYGQDDVNVFLGHKGPKMVIWGGNDMHPPQLNLVKKEIDKGNTFTFATPGHMVEVLSSYNIPHKIFYLEVKDYSLFNPSPLGENIYVYMGRPSFPRPDYYKYNEIVSPLVKVFGKDRVKWVIQNENSTLPQNQLIKKYYNDCFVYVKPNERGGNTSMWELSHMGRKTIGKGQSPLPGFTEYKNLEHLLELIIEESKYIGKVRPEIAENTKKLFIGEEFLNLNYWKNGK